MILSSPQLLNHTKKCVIVIDKLGLLYSRCYSACYHGFEGSIYQHKSNSLSLNSKKSVNLFMNPLPTSGPLSILFQCHHQIQINNQVYRSLFSSCNGTKNNLFKKNHFSLNLISNNKCDFVHSNSHLTMNSKQLEEASHGKFTLMNKINNVLNNSDGPQGDAETIPKHKNITEQTIESQIVHHMNCWEIDEAINVLKDSIAEGASPDRTILVKMLQQIAELGKVNCLLELYSTILKDKALVSSENFYMCLCSAIYTSGQVVEGMDILKKNYQAGMDIGEVDIAFTVLGTMIIKHFEDHVCLVEDFVDTLLASDTYVDLARALLWKCFVLGGKFDQADELRLQHKYLQKLIPAQVSSIVQSSSPSSHIDFDKETVLLWLVKRPYLKKRLQASALHLLVQLKCDENEWGEAIKYMSLAMDNSIKIQPETMRNFLTRFFAELSDDEFAMLEKIGDLLETTRQQSE